MEYDFCMALELSMLACNIKKEICGVLDDFSFFRKYEKKIP
jgi:hypothetical protein